MVRNWLLRLLEDVSYLVAAPASPYQRIGQRSHGGQRTMVYPMSFCFEVHKMSFGKYG